MKKEIDNEDIEDLVCAQSEIIDFYLYPSQIESERNIEEFIKNFRNLKYLSDDERKKFVRILTYDEESIRSKYLLGFPYALLQRLVVGYNYYKCKKDIGEGKYSEESIKYIIENRQKEFYLRLLQKEIDRTENNELRERLIEEKYKQLIETMSLEDKFINDSNFWSTAYSNLSTLKNRKLKDERYAKMLKDSFNEILKYSNLTFNDLNKELFILKIKFKSVLLLFKKSKIIKFKRKYLAGLDINFFDYSKALSFISECIDGNIKNKEFVFNLRIVK
jgi:hypothetical protein